MTPDEELLDYMRGAISRLERGRIFDPQRLSELRLRLAELEEQHNGTEQ